jgi:hypothetical protein
MNVDTITVNGKRVHLCWLVGWNCWREGDQRLTACKHDA